MAQTSFKSNIIANIGISMGDEGKGRLVYELIEDIKKTHPSSGGATMVLKVNGGANSGHTAAGLKLNLLPSGITKKEIKHLAIGGGVVADPRKIWWELKPLEALGYDVQSRLIIDEKTQVSDVSHRLLDLANEHYREFVLGEEARGSTGRGITPAFADEVGQWQIYYADFQGPKDDFKLKLQRRVNRAIDIIRYVYKVDESAWNKLFETLTVTEVRANKKSIEKGVFNEEEFRFERYKGTNPFEVNFETMLEDYWSAGTALTAQIRDLREQIIELLRDDEFVIGEYGQSFWLDKRQGFSPNVTASHTYTPEIFFSAGIPVQKVHTIGCAKAYDTKVGTHLFLTEIQENHPLGEHLKQFEYGTSTGRQRMVGWFDAVEKGDALRYGGYHDLAINKLDVLKYQGAWQGGELLVCTSYRDDEGKEYYTVPRNDAIRKALKPVYRQYPGWSESISHIRSFEDLPDAAKKYVIGMLEAIVNVAFRNGHKGTLPNLRYIGVGADPGEVITDIPATEELLKGVLV